MMIKPVSWKRSCFLAKPLAQYLVYLIQFFQLSDTLPAHKLFRAASEILYPIDHKEMVSECTHGWRSQRDLKDINCFANLNQDYVTQSSVRVPNFNTLTLENSYFHSNSYDYSVSLITFLAYTLLIDILQRQGEGPPPCQHEVQQHVGVTTLCTSKHQPCYSTFLLHCIYNPIVIVWGTWGCTTPPSPECARPQFTVKTLISPSEAFLVNWRLQYLMS